MINKNKINSLKIVIYYKYDYFINIKNIINK